MMVCYDGFFPEVARELSNRGAEIIAWPVWAVILCWRGHELARITFIW